MKGIYVLMGMLLLFSSCKKKDDDNPQPDPSAAVVKSVSQVPGEQITYTYDSQGRVESIRNTNGTGMNISYSGDTVREAMLNDSGFVFAINTLFLNSSGIANSSLLRDTSGVILSYSQYTYDTANFKIDEKTYDPFNTLSAHKEWTILASNVYYYTSTDSLNYPNNAEISYTYAFENENTTGNDNTGRKYHGKSSKNLERSMHKIGTTGNVRYTFQYTFDSSGRVATKTAYNHLSEVVYTNTYTYN